MVFRTLNIAKQLLNMAWINFVNLPALFFFCMCSFFFCVKLNVLWMSMMNYVTLVVNIFWLFYHSWPIITGFITILIRRVPLVQQELFTLPEYLRLPPAFSGVYVTLSLVLCVCFVDRCLSFYPFSFGHCVLFRILITFLVSSNSSSQCWSF